MLHLTQGGSLLLQPHIPVHFTKLPGNALFDKEIPWVLRQHGQTILKKAARWVLFQFFSQHLHLSPIGAADSANGTQGGGFSTAVAAHYGIETALGNGECQSF